MKRVTALYYLLFFLLIMGAFASMAQNNYGIKMLGAVSVAFGVLFAMQLITQLGKDEHRDGYLVIELICLIVLSAIFALRIFYVRFPYIDWLFMLAAGILCVLYVRKMVLSYRALYWKSRPLAISMLAFYGSIALFLVSILFMNDAARLSRWAGIAGLLLVVLLALLGFFTKRRMVEGENMTGFARVYRTRENSILIISILFLFSLYSNLTRSGALPGIYSDEYPQAYYEMIKKDNTSQGAAANATKTIEFKEKYNDFVKRNITVNK